MKNLVFVAVFGILSACSHQPNTNKEQTSLVKSQAKFAYPNTRRGGVVDDYFGTLVADPYRWLEDDLSDETAAWVTEQNKLTFGYLETIPYRKQLVEQLKSQLNYERVSSPFKEGDYTYFYKNDGLQNHSVVYRQKGQSEAEVFLDPNTFSDDATTSLASLSFSRDGSIVAYSISEGGSDWRKIIIMDVESRKIIEDPLQDVKFSGISWYKNEGFYYSSYDKPEDSELSAKTDQHKLYYHKIGTAQSEDTLVFGGTRVLQSHVDADSWVVDNVGSKLYIQTNVDAPNNRLVVVDVADPNSDNWQEVIPEQENVLSVSSGAGYLFASYMVDATSRIYQYAHSGKKIREVALPGIGTATSIYGKRQDQSLYYTFENYITPGTIFSYDARSGDSNIYRKSGAKFDSADYVSKQVFYKSKDGTRIPMIITHKKGIAMDGSNPTLLYGYGGFNVSLKPNFTSIRTPWMNAGGIVAVPSLRGGGEYGKKWHDGGRLLNKQNVFDDFIAASEYLIQEKYTSPDYLAVQGGSNGGLLVGAVMTQRPALFKVALPAVGVLDMLRYHTFTAGAGWAYDYGTSEQTREMFDYLKGYSPLHNVRHGTHYPATLVTTADHDDRVVPAHSFKFAAELQAKQSGSAPTLIRIETNAGHGAGMSIDKRVELYADIYAFTLHQMGVKSL